MDRNKMFENGKLSSDMDILEIANIMSEGNPGALETFMQMVNNDQIMDIYLCDSLDIRGYKLYMLNKDCCGKNTNKLKCTINMFRNNTFSKEEIQNNLNLTYALPFIDDSITVNGIPAFNNCDPNNDNWDEFCKKNRESFIKRYNMVAKANKKIPSYHPINLDDNNQKILKK